MHRKNMGFGVIGMACAVGCAATAASAYVPLTFDTTAGVHFEAIGYDFQSYGSASDSGTNYAECVLDCEGPGQEHHFSGFGTISCDSTVEEVATIDIRSSGHAAHAGGVIHGTFDVRGSLAIGTTSSCPEGTPVLLSISSDYDNMFEEFGGEYFLISDNSSSMPLYYSSTPPASLELSLHAGDQIDLELMGLTHAVTLFGGFAEIDFTCEVVPEPISALFLLAGIPLIRRR